LPNNAAAVKKNSGHHCPLFMEYFKRLLENYLHVHGVRVVAGGLVARVVLQDR
jgi:hypothetical protein